MTREKLEQLYDLRAEIQEITLEIEKLSRKEYTTVSDSVQTSMKDWPYCQSSARITGHDFLGEERNRRRLEQKRQLLHSRKEAAELLELEITQYINSIPNSKVRRIMQKHYINQIPWNKIAMEMHTDQSYPCKLVTKYLRNDRKNAI